MRKFENGLKVIGTDLGYGNIKTANTVMPTGLTYTIPSLYFRAILLNITESITVSVKITKNLLPINLLTMIFTY